MTLEPKRHRIVVTGTYCSGKTTLAQMLAGRLDLTYLPEPARELTGLAIGNQLMGEPFRSYLTVRQHVAESLLPARPGAIIDAGLPVVSAFNAAARWELPPRHPQFLDRPDYTLALLTDPSDCLIEDDNFRSVDPHLRARIAEFVESYLEDAHIPVFRISGTPNARLDHALFLLKDLDP